MNLTKKSDFTEENIIGLILKSEGGYVNHPSDPGGETNMGITKRTAELYRTIRVDGNKIDLWDKHKFNGNMKNLPKALAVDIYDHVFWDAIKGDELHKIHPFLAYQCFDFGVNAGVARSAKHLQLALNNLTGSRLALDGIIGNGTLNVLEKYTQEGVSKVKILVETLLTQQLGHYDSIIRANPKLNVFRKGWTNRVEEKRKLMNKVGF